MKSADTSSKSWLVIIFLLLSSANLQSQQQKQLSFASNDLQTVVASYPNPARYTVTRNGKIIGDHVLSFSVENGLTVVRAESTIKVRFLGIPVYSLSYISEERWVGDELVYVSARTVENGSGNTVSYDLASAEERAAYASNHWHPGVVLSPHIFNTLTGDVEQVDVSGAFVDTISGVDGEPLEALRFTYHYESPVNSWYDTRGRWVKMMFTRDDGSVIEYIRSN